MMNNKFNPVACTSSFFRVCMFCFLPFFSEEALIQHYEIKPRHPIQYLGDVAKNMHWGIPVYNLIQESRNIDTSFSFLYSVTINDVQVVAKEPAPNKKQGRKLAAVTCLEKLRLFKIP